MMIRVEEKDVQKTFEILANNGRFMGLRNNRFIVQEHVEKVLQELKKNNIKFKDEDDAVLPTMW